jgi:methylamine utilization protein MauE
VPAVVAAILFGAFTVVVVRAQVRGLPCPCFGAGAGAADTETRPSALVRNGLLLGYAVLATASPAGAHPGAVVGATVVLGSVAAGAVRLAGRHRAVNRRN